MQRKNPQQSRFGVKNTGLGLTGLKLVFRLKDGNMQSLLFLWMVFRTGVKTQSV